MQKRIEIVEKSSARARQRHRTKENIPSSASTSSLFLVQKSNPIPENKGRKPKTVPQKPARTRQTSVQEPKIETQQNQSLENLLNENRKVVIENEHNKAAKNLELETVPLPEYGEPSESVQNKEKAVENGDISDDDEDTQNDKLVKMLKKIDTQTLKRRLSLDKLDDLDTDDEVLGNLTLIIILRIRNSRRLIPPLLLAVEISIFCNVFTMTATVFTITETEKNSYLTFSFSQVWTEC